MILRYLAETGVAGGAAFLIYLLLRPLLERTLSQRWKRELLLFFCLLFAVPFGMLADLLPMRTAELHWESDVLQEEVQQAFFTEASGVETAEENPAPTLSHILEQPILTPWSRTLSVSQIIQVALITVALLLLCIRLYGYLRFQRSCLAGSVRADGSRLLELLRREQEELGIDRRVELRLWNFPATPMATGVIHPKIYLPQRASENLHLILRHELVHIQQQDLLVKLLLELLCVLHWCNPFVFLLKREFDTSCEYAADERATQALTREEKKQYCSSLLETACAGSGLPFSAALGGGKRTMKKRLNLIMTAPKITKKALVLLLTGMLVLGAFSVLGANALYGTMEQKTKNGYVVIVKENELWQVDFNGSQLRKLDGGENLTKPVISPKGGYVAYLKEGRLLVCNLNNGMVKQLADSCLSFDWNGEEKLAYSKESGGLQLVDILSSQTTQLGKSDFRYEDITCGKDGAIYVKKQRISQGENLLLSTGIYRLEGDLGLETLLLTGYPEGTAAYEMGFDPTIAGISEDGNYLYVWDRTLSASLSADGVSFGVYDLSKAQYTPCAQAGGILQAPGNFSPNPQNPLEVAFNRGSGREMGAGKQAGLLETAECRFTPFLSPDLTSMTVRFAPDGTSIYFSAGAAATQTYSLYRKDGKTGDVTRLTNGQFDFAPLPLEDGSLLFLRGETNGFGLWKLKDGREMPVVSGIRFEGDNEPFYGAYPVENILDYYE